VAALGLSLQASRYLSEVSGRSCIVQHTSNHLTSSAGGMRVGIWKGKGYNVNALQIQCQAKIAIVFLTQMAELFTQASQMLSVYKTVCLDINHGGTNRNRCTQRLVISHAPTY